MYSTVLIIPNAQTFFFILPAFTHSLASVLKVHLMTRGGVGAVGAGGGWEVGGFVIGRAVPDDKCIRYNIFLTLLLLLLGS